MARPVVRISAGGARAVLRAPGVVARLDAMGERVAERARMTAPVDTGAYRDGITVWSDVTDRAVTRVGSTAPHARLVEANTGNLARALDAAGGS